MDYIQVYMADKIISMNADRFELEGSILEIINEDHVIACFHKWDYFLWQSGGIDENQPS